MNCVGCGCSTFNPCMGGCHWVSVNPPICSACETLFADDDLDGEAFDNVVGAAGNDNASIGCAHTQRLYSDTTNFKCCSCGEFFCDAA